MSCPDTQLPQPQPWDGARSQTGHSLLGKQDLDCCYLHQDYLNPKSSLERQTPVLICRWWRVCVQATGMG